MRGTMLATATVYGVIRGTIKDSCRYELMTWSHASEHSAWEGGAILSPMEAQRICYSLLASWCRIELIYRTLCPECRGSPFLGQLEMGLL